MVLFKILLFLFLTSMQTSDFKSSQMQHTRVSNAYSEKEKFIQSLMQEKNIHLNQLTIFIRIFKHEKLLEVWGKNKKDSTFQSIIRASRKTPLVPSLSHREG